MSYGYTPDLIDPDRFERDFPLRMVECLADLRVSDLLPEEELRKVMVYMNQNRPFTTNGEFTFFEASNRRQAQMDILHRLYSVWWAEAMQKISLQERLDMVSALRIHLAVINNRDWSREQEPTPFCLSVSA